MGSFTILEIKYFGKKLFIKHSFKYEHNKFLFKIQNKMYNNKIIVKHNCNVVNCFSRNKRETTFKSD